MLWSFSLPTVAIAQPLKIGFHEFAPFSFNENETATGALVELARIVCNELPQGCEFSIVPNPRAKQLLAQGSIDALFMGWNEERATQLLFSLPLLETEYGFYTLPPLQPKSLTDLEGLSVGVFVPSNTHYELLKLNNQLLTNDKKPFRVVEFPQGNQLPLRMLQKGRFDAYFVNRDVGAWYAAREEIGSLIYLPAAGRIQYCLAFEDRPEQKEKVKQFNHIVYKLSKAGRFDATLNQWKMSPSSLTMPADLHWNMPF